ncbi:MAG: IgGFc-binding protein [Nannocystaceae bacterium]
MRTLPLAKLPAALSLAALVGCNGDDPASSATGATASTTATSGEVTSSGAETTTTTTTGDSGTASASGATDETAAASTGTTGALCPAGAIVCDGDVAQTCDGMGGTLSEEDCGEGVCVEGVGCVLCVPGEATCDGDVLSVCNDAGDGSVEETCDPLQGLSCDAELAQCVGACATSNIGLSYIGCDYYPTVLPQHDDHNTAPADHYAVSVSNTAAQAATITVTRGGEAVLSDTVPASSVRVFELPWVDDLAKGWTASKVVDAGAYRLRSDVPVTVYQYNPIASTTTNDASLLLPVNAWTGNYVVAAWKHTAYSGFYAVVASEDGTTVELHPSKSGGHVKEGGGVNLDGTGTVSLDAGDVLLVQSSLGDLTGTIVAADKPVQAFGGHKCATVPPGYCDHLEEALLPIEALAKEYLIAPTAQYPDAELDKPQIVRIIATEDDTALSYEPDQPAKIALAKAGDFADITDSTARFKITADKKVLVAQYMVGQSPETGESDPAFVQAIPADQFRDAYLFHAPPSWNANYVDIIAPDGAAVEVDGAAVGGFTAIGATGYAVAHVALSNDGDGNHSVSADAKVGISVYGIQDYGTYWYPGGTDLVVLPQ